MAPSIIEARFDALRGATRWKRIRDLGENRQIPTSVLRRYHGSFGGWEFWLVFGRLRGEADVRCELRRRPLSGTKPPSDRQDSGRFMIGSLSWISFTECIDRQNFLLARLPKNASGKDRSW